MSNERRPSRPASHRQEQEYETRRRESDYYGGESRSRSSARDYDDFGRPRSNERGGSRPPSGNRPASGSRPPSGNRPASGSRPPSGNRPAPRNRPASGSRPPARHPVKRKRRRLPILPILFLAACVVIVILIFKACDGKENLPEGAYTLEFSPSQSLFVGDTGKVSVVGLPEDFDGTIQWSSSKTSILEVDNGNMRARNPGEAQIVAIIDGEAYTGTVVVYAIPENISSLTLNHSNATMLSGSPLQLEAIVVLDDDSEPVNLPVSWSSTNPAVAIVTADGLVTARDVGSAAITARMGNQSAVCVIDVQKSTDGEPVQSGEGYGDPEETDEGEDGQTETPTETQPPVTTTPPSTTTPPPTTTTPPPTTNNGNNNNNNNSNSNSNAATVSSLSLSQKIGYLNVGGTLVLGVTVSPSSSSVSWSSSNPAVATVSPSGVVTAVGEGDAVITATAGSLSSYCSIQVDVSDDPNTPGGSGEIPDPGHL